MRALLSGSSKKRPLEDAADADGNGAAANDSDSSSEPDDEVRLWEGGWKERYYRSKFQVESSDKNFIGKVVGSYVEGLSWVLRYYYQVRGSFIQDVIKLKVLIGLSVMELVLSIPLCTFCIRFCFNWKGKT